MAGGGCALPSCLPAPGGQSQLLTWSLFFFARWCLKDEASLIPGRGAAEKARESFLPSVTLGSCEWGKDTKSPFAMTRGLANPQGAQLQLPASRQGLDISWNYR